MFDVISESVYIEIVSVFNSTHCYYLYTRFAGIQYLLMIGNFFYQITIYCSEVQLHHLLERRKRKEVRLKQAARKKQIRIISNEGTVKRLFK